MISNQDELIKLLDRIEKRLSAIEMMLSITYSPNYLLDDDKLYKKVLRSIKKLDKVSSSYLQRKFSIGYARAAKFIDQMEEEGIIGKEARSKRKLLKNEKNNR